MKILTVSFILIFLSPNLILVAATHQTQLAQETNPKAFKLLKEKSIDPKTGLPKTLDPSLFEDKAKEAYRTAIEIPEVLAQMPCFCGCEDYGHDNLVDCFVDRHGDD